VFQSLPGAIALLTRNFVILDVNEGFLEAAGRGLADVAGRALFEAFPPRRTRLTPVMPARASCVRRSKRCWPRGSATSCG